MFRAAPRRRGQGLARGGDPFAVLLLIQLAQQLARGLGGGGAAGDGPVAATLALAASMLATYFAPDLADAGLIPERLAATLAPPLDAVCLQPRLVVEGRGATSSSSVLLLRRLAGRGGARREWSRLVASAFTHADLSHLVYNVSSLLWKGSILERRMGSGRFLALFAELLLLSHGLFVASAYALSGGGGGGGTWSSFLPPHLVRNVGWPMYAHTCAVGCSAVLFALKVVLQADARGDAVVAWGGPFLGGGLRVPARHASWFELVLASAVNPRASFAGHLCGILAGLLHVKVLEPAWRRRRGRWLMGLRLGGWGGGGGGGGGAGRRLAGGGGDGAPAARPHQQQRRRRQEEEQQRAPPPQQQHQRGEEHPPPPPLSAEELRAARLRRLGG